MGGDEHTGTRLLLPADACPPFEVYANGALLREGADYDVGDGELRLRSPRPAGRREGLWKKLVMSTAGIGFYGRGDAFDVHYRTVDGAPGMAIGLRVEPDAP